MTLANRWPQVGDLAVDLTISHGRGQHDRASRTKHIRDVTDTLVITADGAKYNRESLTPLGQGSGSARRLVPPGDARVLAARGREHLAELASLAANLSDLNYRMPEEVIAALARVITTAHESRVALAALMAEASRAEQESDR
jgi:hypothetical protein